MEILPLNHLKFFQIGNTLEKLSHETKENQLKLFNFRNNAKSENPRKKYI